MSKNLQRDCRDIRHKLDKIAIEQALELNGKRMERTRVRLQEIAAILSAQTARSPLVDVQEVNALIQLMQARPPRSLSLSRTA